MRNPYSRPLLKIYETARKLVDDFDSTITSLINGGDIYRQSHRRYYRVQAVQINSNSLSFKNSEALVDANKILTETCEKLNADVLTILEKIPQVSFRIRFNEPKTRKAGILEKHKDYLSAG